MWLAQDRGVDLARLGQAPVDPIEQIQAQARQQVEQARQEEPQALYAQLQQAQEQQRAAYEQKPFRADNQICQGKELLAADRERDLCRSKSCRKCVSQH